MRHRKVVIMEAQSEKYVSNYLLIDLADSVTQLSNIPHQARNDAALSWVKVALTFNGQAELINDENAWDVRWLSAINKESR